MNRVEQNKLKHEKRLKNLKTFIVSLLSTVALISILFMGLSTVDKVNRSMLMIEEDRLLDYSTIAKNQYEIVFCGDKYTLDTEKLDALLNKTKISTSKELEEIKKLVAEKSKAIEKIFEKVNEKTKELFVKVDDI